LWLVVVEVGIVELVGVAVVVQEVIVLHQVFL
jgi:hypothetical protein